jgi:hypothetical protein
MKKRGLKIFSILVLSKSGSVFAKKVVLGSYLQKISYLICRIAQVGGGGVVGWGPSVGGALTAVGQHVGGCTHSDRAVARIVICTANTFQKKFANLRQKHNFAYSATTLVI